MENPCKEPEPSRLYMKVLHDSKTVIETENESIDATLLAVMSPNKKVVRFKFEGETTRNIWLNASEVDDLIRHITHVRAAMAEAGPPAEENK